MAGSEAQVESIKASLENSAKQKVTYICCPVYPFFHSVQGVNFFCLTHKLNKIAFTRALMTYKIFLIVCATNAIFSSLEWLYLTMLKKDYLL